MISYFKKYGCEAGRLMLSALHNSQFLVWQGFEQYMFCANLSTLHRDPIWINGVICTVLNFNIFGFDTFLKMEQTSILTFGFDTFWKMEQISTRKLQPYQRRIN